VVGACSLTFLAVDTLRDEASLPAQLTRLPAFLSDTILHHDFGYDGVFQKPLWNSMLDGLPVDLTLVVGGLVIGNVAGVWAGLRAGAQRGSREDRVAAIGSAAVLSVPVYWMGFMTLTLFAPGTGYLLRIPILSDYGGYVPLSRDPLGWLRAVWVPCLVVAAPLAAMSYRMVRASLADLAEEQFVRGARAKGVAEPRVMRRHALPVALSPVLSLAAVNMALVVTNVTLVETTFQLPGFFRRADIGQFLGELGHAPGIDVIHLLVFEAATIIAVAMVLCDLAQAWLDPRLRASG
jgi:peptide/nickel transport system permease protein